MRQRQPATRRLLAALAVCSAAVVPTIAAAAVDARPAGVPLVGAPAPAPRSVANRPGAFMIRLDGPPAVAAATTARHRGASVAQAARQSRRQRSDNATAQHRVMETANARGLVSLELYRVSTAFNGVAVLATAEDVHRLRSLSGVRSVVPLPRHERTNAASVPAIGAPAAWAAPGGLTGQGVRVGVIDTGIDYVHRAFGGSGSPSDLTYARSGTSNPLASGPPNPSFAVTPPGGSQLYPSPRVTGGFDFAGDAYDADSVLTAVPRPDPNPLDCPVAAGGGHGTHVAGTVGGDGVASTGGTLAWQSAWPPALTPAVGTGVAPGASLVALRVLGCGGSTNLVPLAIEWAIDPNGDGNTADRLDVLNLSLGSPFGNQDDPSTIAMQNAVAAGVAVVVAAGNSGDQTYQVGSPGVADRALTVANVVLDSRRDAIEVSGPSGADGHHDASLAGTVNASSSRGPAGGGGLKPDLAAPGTDIRSAAAGTGSGASTLTGTSMSAPHVAGALAILRQQHPAWTVEELKAAAINTADPDVRAGDGQSGEGGPKYTPARVGTGTIDVAAAIDTDVVAFADDTDADGAVGASFGPLRIPVGAPFVRDRTISVVNHGVGAATYAVAFDERNHVPGVAWELPDGPTVTIPAGDRASIRLRLRVDDPTQLRNHRDPTLDATQPTTSGTFGRRWLAEATGLVRLSRPGRPTLSVAAHASVRPAAATRVAAATVELPAGATAGSIVLTGSAFSTGDTVTDFAARRTMLELQATSPQRTVAAEDPAYLRADVRHVGVGGSGPNITFGVTTWGPSPAPDGFADVEIAIDRNRDGQPERYVYPARMNDSDVFATCVRSAPLNLSVGCYLAASAPEVSAAEGGTYDSEIVTMTVPRTAVGLTGSTARFAYTVRTRATGSGDEVDTVGPLTWSPDAPGVRFATDQAVADVPATVSFDYDAAAARTNGSLGALILHHLGAEDQVAETIGVIAEAGPAVDPPVVDPPVVDPPVVDPPVADPPHGDPSAVLDPPAVVPPSILAPSSPMSPPAPTAPAPRCRVPRLTGRSLGAARTQLRRARCRLGTVTTPKPRTVRGQKRRLRPLVVSRQSIQAGRLRPSGTKVAVRLRERPRR